MKVEVEVALVPVKLEPRLVKDVFNDDEVPII